MAAATITDGCEARRHRLAAAALAPVTMLAALALATGTARADSLGDVTEAQPTSATNTAPAATFTFTTTDTFPAAPAPAPTVLLTSTVDTTVSFSGTDTTVTDTTPTGSQVTSTFNVDPTGWPAAPGGYSVTVCQPVSGVADCSSSPVIDTSSGALVTLSAPDGPPAVTSLSRDRLATNAGTIAGFAINGTGFAQGDQVAFVSRDSGQPVSTLGFAPSSSSTEGNLTSDLTGLASTAVGGYDLEVSDTVGQTSATGKADLLQVVAPPTVTSGPISVRRGAASTATLTVTDFPASPVGDQPGVAVSAAGVTASAGTPVTDPTDSSVTDIPVTISATTSAPLGQATLTLTDVTTGGTAAPVTLTVLTQAPTLSAITPDHVGLGSTGRLVTLTGAGFQSGLGATTSESGVTVDITSVDSDTQASATVDVAADAQLCAVDVTLTNPDGGSSTAQGALTVDAFTVTGTNPTTSTDGAAKNSVPVTVSGQDLPSDGTTQLVLTPQFTTAGQGPITVSGTTAADGMSWSGNADLSIAAVGSYAVTLVHGTTSAVCSCTFAVTSGGAPTVTGVSPASIGQGGHATLVVSGTNFAHGATVGFPDTSDAAAVGGAVVDSATKLEVPVQIASSAATGVQHDVTVTVGSATATCSGCLSVTPAPYIGRVVPAELVRGGGTTLTIYGASFDSQATVSFGPGVSTTGPAAVSAREIDVPIAVAPDAPSSVTVTVTNPYDSASSTTLSVHSPPTVAAVSPRWVDSAYDGTLTIVGSGFDPGATVSFPSDSGVSVTEGSTPAVSSDGTTITVPVTVDRDGPAPVDVTVTDSDLSAVTCAGCLGVAVAPNDPDGVASTVDGTSVTVTWTDVPDSGDGGAPITGYTVSVTSPAGAAAPQTVAPGATSATFTGLSAGADYTFSVVATNAAGSSSPGASTTATIPGAGASSSAGTTQGGSLVPSAVLRSPRSAFSLGAFRVAWAATTPGSRAASYQIRYRRASYSGRFGSWIYPRAWRRLTVTALRHTERPGWTDCFAVRVRTSAGVTSAWSRPRCSARPLDDRALAAAGRWSRRTGRTFYMRTVTTTSARGARLSVAHARVDRIALVVTRCPRCGRVAVYVGAHWVATVDLRAAHLHRRVLVVLRRQALRVGTVRLRVVSTGRPVQIDGLGLTRV